MSNPNPEARPRLRLRVNAAAEDAVRGGHPWVFADSVREQNREAPVGELAVIYDRKDRFLAIGIYDPASPLRVRILHVGKPVTLDDAWWRQHLQAALERRRDLFDERTTGYRLISGESDGWPGLVLDRYGSVYVLKLYTAAWLPRLDQVVLLLQQALQPERLVLRLSRNIQQTARGDFNLVEGSLLLGAPLDSSPIFLETGLSFEAEVLRGQKTGFFLDQRENRRRVETLARGREVLNAFSFSGGFSLYAARGGATSVTDLDMSAHALASARRNFALNLDDAGVARCRHETIQGDVFVWLEENSAARFDLVILDPPSMARRQAERVGALRAYGTLARGGLKLLRPGGILVAASCSAHVSAAEFSAVVHQAAREARRVTSDLATTAHAPDHPATFPEANYLKCIFLQT